MLSVRDTSDLVWAQTRYLRLAEAFPEPLLVIDHHERITVVSEKAERVFGWKREQLVGSQLDRVLVNYPRGLLQRREPPPGPPAAGSRPHARPAGEPDRASAVSAPVRIADAASVRLLHPGDRVDVIAGEAGTRRARVVARDVRVDRVPRSVETGPGGAAEDGALVVLRVPRGTATALAGAGAAGRLAVTLC